MIKELEALNDLWKRLEEVNQPMINDYEFIKSALEHKDKLETENADLKARNEKLKKALKTLEKYMWICGLRDGSLGIEPLDVISDETDKEILKEIFCS